LFIVKCNPTDVEKAFVSGMASSCGQPTRGGPQASGLVEVLITLTVRNQRVTNHHRGLQKSRALVNTIMNLRVQQKEENLLT